jgi:hypothetical protein
VHILYLYVYIYIVWAYHGKYHRGFSVLMYIYLKLQKFNQRKSYPLVTWQAGKSANSMEVCSNAGLISGNGHIIGIQWLYIYIMGDKKGFTIWDG